MSFSRFVDVSDTAWLNETINVPRRLAVALGFPAQVKRFIVLERFADDLGLDSAKTSADVETLLDMLVWPLNRVLESEAPMADHWPRATAHAVVANHWPYDLVNLAEEFGWSNETAVQGTTTFAHLQDAVEQSFEVLLANRIFVMLRRWEKQGILDRRAAYPAARRRTPKSN